MNSSLEKKRALMGVPGLDEVLGGGLPRDRLYLVQGDPGVGKTTLALQFLLTGAEAGEVCLYVTLSETKEELCAVADSHGWSLDKLELFELPNRADYGEDNTMFHPSEVELAETTKALLDEVARVKPTRVVFDSLSEIRLLSQGPLRYRRPQIDALVGGGLHRGTSTLLMGPAGTGKSTVAIQYAKAAAATGQHAAIFAFDESVSTLRDVE